MRTSRSTRGYWALVAAISIAACGGDDDDGAGAIDAAPTPDSAPAPDASLIEQRPYDVLVPAGYDEATPTPLIIALHGSAQPGLGLGMSEQLRLPVGAQARTWLVATPNGTELNSDDECCRWNNAMDPAKVDDVEYLTAVLDDIESRFNVDPNQIHMIGYSSGGFMTEVMGCALNDRLASIVSIAAAMWTDRAFCTTGSRMSVLHIIGEVDQTVNIDGGTTTTGRTYESAVDTLAFWAGANGCTGALAETGNVYDIMADLGASVADETIESTYGDCPTGVDVTFWPAQEQNHFIVVNATSMPDLLYDFLEAHPVAP